MVLSSQKFWTLSHALVAGVPDFILLSSLSSLEFRISFRSCRSRRWSSGFYLALVKVPQLISGYWTLYYSLVVFILRSRRCGLSRCHDSVYSCCPDSNHLAASSFQLLSPAFSVSPSQSRLLNITFSVPTSSSSPLDELFLYVALAAVVERDEIDSFKSRFLHIAK